MMTLTKRFGGPWTAGFLFGLLLGVVVPCGRASAQGANEQAALEALGKARARIRAFDPMAALSLLERARSYGLPSVSSPAGREALRILEGLSIDVVHGNGQMGTHKRPPKQPLVARVLFKVADESRPASGFPVAGRWSVGTNAPLEGFWTDGNGLVSVKVPSMPEKSDASFEMRLDLSRIPLFADSSFVDTLIASAAHAATSAPAVFRFKNLETPATGRVIVLVHDLGEDRKELQPIVQDRLTRALVDINARVVGMASLGKSQRKMVMSLFRQGRLDAVRPEIRMIADYILYGTVSVGGGEQNAVGAWYCRASGTVSLYDLDASNVVITASIGPGEGRGFGANDYSSCVEDAQRAAADYLVGELASAMSTIVGEVPK